MRMIKSCNECKNVVFTRYGNKCKLLKCKFEQRKDTFKNEKRI